MATTHDEHFLIRLERLEAEHAELALGLYYDRELVEHILGVAKVPDEAERIALCLGEPDAGPHVIVARDGHFVTALGEGMVLRPDQPVISRHRLDAIAESVQSLRSLSSEAREGGRRAIQRRMQRLYEAGSGLSQEEFDDLVRWLPMLRMVFLQTHVELIDRCQQLAERVSRYKRFSRRAREEVHDYWRTSWAAAHLTLLLAGDGGVELRRILEIFEEFQEGTALALPWTMIRLGTTAFAARGAWVASKMPALIVPQAKRRFHDENATFLSTMTDGLCLSAVGMRHQKYRAEVRKVLARSTDENADVRDAIRAVVAARYEHQLDKPEAALAAVEDFGLELIRAIYTESGYTDETVLDALKAEHGMPVVMSIPGPFCKEPEYIDQLFSWLPWIVRAEARDFYLPEPHVNMVRPEWALDEGLALVEARVAAVIHRPQPVRRGPKIGRNAPCPCDSGKKYKRCCGKPASAR